MRISFSSAAQSALLLASCLSLALARTLSQPTALQARSDDAFYYPPAGFENLKPGTVLRSRKILSSIFGFIPSPVESYQLLYRTTSTNGSATATVTTVFRPLFAKSDRFVTLNTAYDSSASKCSPSHAFHLGETTAALTISTVESLSLQAYLVAGYVVSSSDFEGPEAAFGAAHIAGMGVLDSMRAVRNFAKTLRLSSNPSIVATGYSGAAQATAWAAALHPTYAPDLKISGWATGGVVADINATFYHIDGSAASALALVAIAGLLKPTAYGAELGGLFKKIITPAGQAALDFASTECILLNIVKFAFKSFRDTKYQTAGPGFMQHPVVVSVLRNNILGFNKTETPTVPVLMQHARHDEIVPFAPAARAKDVWCGNGATVKWKEYAAGGHLTTYIPFFLESLRFTRDAFAGRIHAGCTSETALDEPLDPFALGFELEPLLTALVDEVENSREQEKNPLESIKKGQSILI